VTAINELKETIDFDRVGEEMHRLMARLFPICRSITGEGVRKSLEIIQESIPLAIREIPTGTQVFDWTVPKEWNIRDAHIRRSTGERVVDFKACNLHVMGYSSPINARMPLSELKKHLFTLPDHPDWIPYRTSYYNENWGFCMSHNELLQLPEDTYEVCIDSSLEDGHLTLADCYVKGESTDEVLLSCHICHPSLCNDNLSGMVLATFLAGYLRKLPLRYSYRFLFIPGTIGSIAWLALNHEQVHRIKHGLVITAVGDSGAFTYKRSRQGNAEIDRAVEHALRHCGAAHAIVDFSPYGYDERQYCSPGFDLPVGCLQRTPHGQYPQYHTSADNLDFVCPGDLADSLSLYLSALDVLENNRCYLNTNPKCEPQLGRRGLYTAIGGRSDSFERQMAMLWVLNLSDCRHTLLDIAERSGIKFDLIREVADALLHHGLLQEHLELAD
jgi:aminopeptidase-like protein